MFNISVELNGKKYAKKDATLRDYTALMDYNEKYSGENFLSCKDAFLGAVGIVASWFGCGTDELENEKSLKEIYDLYKQIESNVSEVFLGMPLKTAVQKLTTTRFQKEKSVAK